MAFKMKNGGSAFPYGNSPLKDKEEEEELATEDKAWEDLTEIEKKQRKQTDEMIKQYNISEEKKRKSENK